MDQFIKTFFQKVYKNEPFKAKQGIVYVDPDLAIEVVDRLAALDSLQNKYDQTLKNNGQFVIIVVNALSGTLALAARERFPKARIICVEYFSFEIKHLLKMGFEVVDLEMNVENFTLEYMNKKLTVAQKVQRGDLGAILGNPPYTQLRYVEASKQQKNRLRQFAKARGADSKSLKLSDIMVNMSFDWTDGLIAWLVPDWVQDFNQTKNICYINYRSSIRDVFVEGGVGQKVVVTIYNGSTKTLENDDGVESFNTDTEIWTRYSALSGNIATDIASIDYNHTSCLRRLDTRLITFFKVEDGISSSGNKTKMVLQSDDPNLSKIEPAARIPYADPSNIVANGFIEPTKVTIVPMNEELNASEYCAQHQTRKISHGKVKRWIAPHPTVYIGWNMERHNLRAGYRPAGGIVANTGSVFMIRSHSNNNEHVVGLSRLLNSEYAKSLMACEYPRLKSNTKCIVLSKKLLEDFPISEELIVGLARLQNITDVDSYITKFLENDQIKNKN